MTATAPQAHTFVFGDQSIEFVPGQSIGAALTQAGIASWRTTRVGHRPRGLFCGIGVCYDCVVSVDGSRGERACLVPARDGLRVGPAEVDEGDSPAGLAGEPAGDTPSFRTHGKDDA